MGDINELNYNLTFTLILNYYKIKLQHNHLYQKIFETRIFI